MRKLTNKYSHQGYKNDDNVSPIDETPDVSQLPLGRPGSRPAGGPVPASSIPVMRREKRNQVAAAAQNLVSRKEVGSKGRPTQDPRWDPYSGEITTSDRGKPQSVKPGQFSPPSLKSVNRAPGMGNESSISAAPKAQMSFTDRVRNLRINNNPPPEKPGWKGASGRVTLVNPVADNLDVKPLNIPRKVEKVASPNVVSPVSNFRRDETKDHENPLMSNPASQEQLSKSVHSKGSTPTANSPSSVIHDPFEVRQSPAVDSQREERPDPIAKNTIPRGATESTIVRNFHADLAEAFPKPGDEDYEQPPSRFSVTTYAPSTIQPTPRPSTDTWEQPEMPPLPVKQPDPPSSIVSRKRPQVLGDEPRLPRKAIGSTADPILISMNNSRPARRVSQMSTLSKNLPQSPAEASSNDIISSLQAQIDNLKHRRINIEKSIRQMTELMPQDRMTVTDLVRRKREDEKRKVEALRQEEADVRKEEHELGLKLHRAYKRRDKEGIYEPTTLWVRRVTG